MLLILLMRGCSVSSVAAAGACTADVGAGAHVVAISGCNAPFGKQEELPRSCQQTLGTTVLDDAFDARQQAPDHLGATGLC
jgi:hypothetical protein